MDAHNNRDNTWEHDEYEPETEDDIPALADALAPDPWDDPHNIEYWVWDGERLVPASPAERAAIQEMERAQSARRRLSQWEHAQRKDAQRRHVFVSLTQIITSWRHLWHDSVHPASLHHKRRSEKQEG